MAVDASEEMLSHARERVGCRAEFHHAEVGTALDFDDEAFDGVVSALVLDHVRDWRRTFSEFARLLEPGGFVVFSVVHPVEGYVDYEDVNYFETELVEKEWWSVEIPYYRRPLSEMLAPLLETGFRVDGIAEPQPTETFEEKRPGAYEKESRQPVFLCLRVEKR